MLLKLANLAIWYLEMKNKGAKEKSNNYLNSINNKKKCLLMHRGFVGSPLNFDNFQVVKINLKIYLVLDAHISQQSCQ